MSGLCVVCAAMLAGCATTVGNTLREAGMDQSIVVVGAVDPTLYLQQRGTDPGALGLNTYRVDRWGINDAVADTLADQLKAAGFSNVRVERGWQVRDRLRLTGSYARLNDGQAAAQEQRVQSVARQLGADVLLVAHVGKLGDVFFGTTESITGFGVYQFKGDQAWQGLTFSALSLTVFDDQATQMAHATDFTSRVRSDEQWLQSLRIGEDELDALQPVVIAQHRTLAGQLFEAFGF